MFSYHSKQCIERFLMVPLGIDVALILCIAMLVKDRKEKERYRHIDEKSGTAGF